MSNLNPKQYSATTNDSPLFFAGLNTKIVGKAEHKKLSFPGAFKWAQVDMQSLAEHISSGHPWMPALLNGDRRRQQANANYTDTVAIDIDDGLTIEQALAHPFISAHAGLLIESSSSKPEHHKFRVVFRLTDPIQGWEDIRLAFRYLIHLFGASDPACKDASRFFFGGLGRKAHLLDESARLPESFFADAKTWWDAEEAAYQKQAAIKAEQAKRWLESNGSDPLDEAAEALKFISPYSPGEGRYSSLVAMMGGVVNEFGSAGEYLLKGWGEAGKWGKSWDKQLQSVVRSRPARPATISTLFHLAKEGGYRPKRKPSKGAVAVALPTGSAKKGEAKKVIEAPAKKPKLTATEGFEQDYGYMPDFATVLFPAMKAARFIAIRANCGVGKTQLIKAYFSWLEEQTEDMVPVISATHRNALGESLGEMFGLPVKDEALSSVAEEGFVITVDSACPNSKMKFNGSAVLPQTILFIDEADQTNDHICHSNTAIGWRRTDVIENLCEAGQRSKQVIVCSAGLTDRDVALYQQSMGISERETLRIVNTHKRDMGSVERASSAAEVWFSFEQALKAGEKCMMKLSGKDDESIFSTETALRWINERHQGKRALLLDSLTCATTDNLDTYIDAEIINQGQNGAYSCALVETADKQGNRHFKPRTEKKRILSYLNHADSFIKRFRQKCIFAKYDAVIYTNAAATGISFETPQFVRFFQIENGAGSIDDCMQSTARLRDTNVNRLIYAKPNIRAPHGNGATDPLELKAGKDKNWQKQQLLIGKADSPNLPTDNLSIEGALGKPWRAYSLRLQAERNKQAHSYGEAFFDLLKEANYTIKPAFNGEWAGLGDCGHKDFLDEIKACRDLNRDKNAVETSAEDTEGAELKKLKQQHERTAKQSRQVVKLQAMETYGLDADAVTPEIIKAEKKGLSLRLTNRYYLELGIEAAAERDRAKAAKIQKDGRTWNEDILRGSQAYRVALQSKIGLDKLIEHLRKPDADGNQRTLSKESPEVAGFIKQMVEHREELKNVFRVKVGQIETVENEDGSVDEAVVVERPMAIIQTMLKRLEMNLRAGKRIKGESFRRYSLIDLLDKEQPDGELKPLIDYERFKQIIAKSDAELIAESSNWHTEKIADIEQVEEKVHLVVNEGENTLKDMQTKAFEQEDPSGKVHLVAYKSNNKATKCTDSSALISESGGAAQPQIGTTALRERAIATPDLLDPDVDAAIELPGFYRWGSSLSPWELVSETNGTATIVGGPFSIEMSAPLSELVPWVGVV